MTHSANTALGDVILGVPFLWSASIVMLHAAPDAQSSFASSAANGAAAVDPRLGASVMPFTNPARDGRVRARTRTLVEPAAFVLGCRRRRGAQGECRGE